MRYFYSQLMTEGLLGGLAWIRLPSGEVQAGPMYNLPQKFDGIVTGDLRRITSVLAGITDPKICAEIIATRKRTQAILDWTARLNARIQQNTA